MNTEGIVKLLYSETKLGDTRIWIFECGIPPENEYGDPDLDAFANDFSPNRDVYYEATDMDVKYFRGPFYVGKSLPSDDELMFHLSRWHKERSDKFKIYSLIILAFLYVLFK